MIHQSIAKLVGLYGDDEAVCMALSLALRFAFEQRYFLVAASLVCARNAATFQSLAIEQMQPLIDDAREIANTQRLDYHGNKAD